jgi:hypothetical protein
MEPTTPIPTPEEEPLFQPADFSMEGYDKHVRRARNALFIIAGLILVPIYQLLPVSGELVRVIAILLLIGMSGIYVALGFWSYKKPYTALVVALCLFCVTILANAILSPVSIFYGILFKIAIIVVLVASLSNARDCQRMIEASKNV